MLNVVGKVVILTGASSGIGEATAKVLANSGAKVVLAARREDRLRELKSVIVQEGGIAEYKVTDVASHAEVEELARYTIETFGRIDVLINNAGIMPLSFLHEKKVSEWDQMIDVNIKGVLYGIGAVLPYMREQKKGHIIDVSSVTGHIVRKTWAVYSGTKFAVRAITEAVRQEEAENNIRTTIICPGGVATELSNTITNPDIKKSIEDSWDVALSPEAIAHSILYAISQPENVAVNEIIVRPTKQEL
ncbi:SDR family oxidoreductase [Paenibacillus sp. 7124]|uniref:SDR family oxidoreductase n=1 Tax=Paenibacillus apii TaxID=1850370 RepID=A0A6M1PFF1_9BACL|nr:SDR family oxidoreductase [Paenibacillus apii]NGM82030.1 SDR family oxidoreductase [Paenibacillus apii]NJJ39160.1 SDR family oxidoreductase [Paenibacillus apii]